MIALVMLGPMVLMGLYSRSTAAAALMQAHMGSLRMTGGIRFPLPLLALALWTAWLWLRAGAFERWRAMVAAGSVEGNTCRQLFSSQLHART